MRRTAKKTGLLITSAAAGLATLSHCHAGLLSDLFDKHSDKGRQEIEQRLPACDCEFGYFSTAWQPWGTCDQTSGVGCSNGSCRNSSPSVFSATPSAVPVLQPGYSSGSAPHSIQPYQENGTPPSTMVYPDQPGSTHQTPGTNDIEPAPILMTPAKPAPAATSPALPPASSQPSVISTPSHAPQPSAGNPFPRAIRTNPELPNLNANPYSNPGLSPVPNTPLPNAPQPQLSPRASVPLDPPQQKSLSLPTPAVTPQPSLTQPTPNYGSQGNGITLPPRRATSVTIDVPPGSAGTTLSLPDPVQSGSNFGGDAGLPFPGTETPAATPGGSGAILKPQTPEPSLRRQPPVPTPSVIPGPAATYRLPARQPVPQQFVPRQAAPQFSAVQQAAAPQALPLYPATGRQQFTQATPQQFQPTTHWQAVPQQQPVQQRSWRVMPGAYPQQPVTQQVPQSQQLQQLQPQRRIPTPSERVILLPPPPRR